MHSFGIKLTLLCKNSLSKSHSYWYLLAWLWKSQLKEASQMPNPTSSDVFTIAPLLRRTSTTSSFPFSAAIIKAVIPSYISERKLKSSSRVLIKISNSCGWIWWIVMYCPCIWYLFAQCWSVHLILRGQWNIHWLSHWTDNCDMENSEVENPMFSQMEWKPVTRTECSSDAS